MRCVLVRVKHTVCFDFDKGSRIIQTFYILFGTVSHFSMFFAKEPSLERLQWECCTVVQEGLTL